MQFDAPCSTRAEERVGTHTPQVLVSVLFATLEALGAAHDRRVARDVDYCVTAMSENGASSLSYESEAQCETAQMFWESTIAGQIVVHSVYHPKAGITVSWEVNGFPSLSSSVVTNGAGEFEIHIRDTFNVM